MLHKRTYQLYEVSEEFTDGGSYRYVYRPYVGDNGKLVADSWDGLMAAMVSEFGMQLSDCILNNDGRDWIVSRHDAAEAIVRQYRYTAPRVKNTGVVPGVWYRSPQAAHQSMFFPEDWEGEDYIARERAEGWLDESPLKIEVAK